MEKGSYQAMLREAREHPDLLSALHSIGISLKQTGHARDGGIRYGTGARPGRDGDFSSVAFILNPNGSWVVIDNKQRNGKLAYDALGALTELFGVRFSDAVRLLSSGTVDSFRSSAGSLPSAPSDGIAAPGSAVCGVEKTVFLPPKKAASARHAAAYLTKARGIRGDLVSDLLHRGAIYETIQKSPDGKEMPMVVFPSLDEKGKPVGAECCSAYSSVRFKHIVSGSDPRFGWRFSMGQPPPEAAGKLYFCESAIDAMSLYCLSGAPGTYISLSGLKDETFLHMREFLGGTPVICTDSDEAGNVFRQKYPECETLVPTVGKDWNDQLKAQTAETSTAERTAPPFGSKIPSTGGAKL